MPSQAKIIDAVNLCLKQTLNIDFNLNKTGICEGLANLYIKYSLENKTSKFFSFLDQLAALPRDYRLGDNPALDDFIIQTEKAFRPHLYSGYEIQQGELEKTLSINNKPLMNEFNLGLVTDEATWKELFTKIFHNNRSYYLASKNHAIALSFKNGTFNLYDPNYNTETKQFNSIDDLIKEIKVCLDYTQPTFGLTIRAFAHPQAVPQQHPPFNEIQQIAFKNDINPESIGYATPAKDINTLAYLFKMNKIQYDSIKHSYLLSEFNDLLIQQVKSPELKHALLEGISITLLTGLFKETEKLLTHYQKTYLSSEDQNVLKTLLCQIMNQPIPLNLLLLKKEADYSNLLKMFDKLSLSHRNLTSYNHLKLVTFITQEVNKHTLGLFLSTLSQEQIKKQIYCAAITNQHSALNSLIDHLKQIKLDPKSFSSLFDKELIEKINSTTLIRLLAAGFAVNTQDQQLLSECMQRKDKTIFEIYARAHAKQSNHPELWAHVEKHQYHLINLTQCLDSIPLLNALIFLNKNEQVKKSWTENIPEDMIKSALTTAIWTSNKDMCQFLQKKLHVKNSHLEQDTLEFLCKKGIEENDISILLEVNQLNFNLLHVKKDIPALLNLCHNHQDYSIIETCFAKSSPQIKQIIFDRSLKYDMTPLIKICMAQEPQLFNIYLHKAFTQKAKAKLARLDHAVPYLPTQSFAWTVDAPAQKNLIKYCIKNNLFQLTNQLFNKVVWQEEELHAFLNELVLNKNEYGVCLLLKNNLKLTQMEQLPALLAQGKLLNALDYLLTHEVVLEGDLIEYIFTEALTHNHKHLIKQILGKNLITPQTTLKQPLMLLLKQAIELGHYSVLEPFIQTNQNFEVNFKELFLFSCEKKQARIANQLLSKEFILSDVEKESAIQHLFGEQPASALFDTMYSQAYGRLYPLLYKTPIQNPRATLLNSIKNPEQDPEFQHTSLYLNPLKRAINEKNKKVFHSLFSQSKLPGNPDKEILSFLQDPVLFNQVLPLFEKRYGLNALLMEALKQKDWAALANLIAKNKLGDLNLELQGILPQYGKELVDAYLANLEAHYNKMDVRPLLFRLLDSSNTEILAQCSIPYQAMVQSHIERIELNMLKNHLDLNNQIYRYSFSNQSFKKALEELDRVFKECQKTIINQKINLDAPIQNLEIINNLAQIKLILAGHDISPNYLSDEHTELLQKLIQNPRVKEVCELEFKLYQLLKKNDASEDFNNTLPLLQERLENNKLPAEFVLPSIQVHLKPFQKPVQPQPEPVELKPEPPVASTKHSNLAHLKLKCTEALSYYLSHRDTTLSIFSYCFDYYRGQTRAHHYMNLINSATTEQELYIIEYALFINSNGTQLKKDMTHLLDYENESTAKNDIKSMLKQSYSEEDLTQLDRIIASINNKINANDPTDTGLLFQDELNSLNQLRTSTSPLQNHSLFQAKKPEQKTGFWEWIARCFGFNTSRDKENSLVS
jgi:hypothetical protein